VVIPHAEGSIPGIATGDGFAPDRSARRVAAAKAAAAAGGLLSLSMVLLGQPLDTGQQPHGSLATVRTASVGTEATGSGQDELPRPASVSLG
jgi:hypothetical protein